MKRKAFTFVNLLTEIKFAPKNRLHYLRTDEDRHRQRTHVRLYIATLAEGTHRYTGMPVSGNHVRKKGQKSFFYFHCFGSDTRPFFKTGSFDPYTGSLTRADVPYPERMQIAQVALVHCKVPAAHVNSDTAHRLSSCL
jgi:hypothetical protein